MRKTKTNKQKTKKNMLKQNKMKQNTHKNNPWSLFCFGQLLPGMELRLVLEWSGKADFPIVSRYQLQITY